MSIRPFDHVDVVISGTFDNSEVWTCSFACGRTAHEDFPGGLSVGDLTTACDNVFTFLGGAGAVGLKALQSSSATITAVRAYFRPAGAAAAALSGEHVGSIAGTGSAVVPNQIALVATLLTGAPGRGNRGRTYWPALTSGRVPGNSVVDAYVNAMTNLIASLRTEISAIAGGAAGPLAGNNGLLITRVRADNVPDTQRRRRNKVVSTHTFSADVPVP